MTRIDGEADDLAPAEDIRLAYSAFGSRAALDAEQLQRLERRIVSAAGPALRAARARSNSILDRIVRASLPFALAASLFIAMMLASAPYEATSNSAVATADADALMLGVLNKTIRADVAASRLASQDASTSALWNEISE